MAPSTVISVRIPEETLAQLALLYESRGLAIHSRSALVSGTVALLASSLPPVDSAGAKLILARVFGKPTLPSELFAPPTELASTVADALANFKPVTPTE